MSTAHASHAFHNHERYLWGVCYRMTGCAADADDLVQEAFARLLERPPARLDAPLRPWLLKVTVNLCRDLLRHRSSSAYIGPWLPSPLNLESSPLVSDEGWGSGARRYELKESATFAFLLAVEALTPTQRAVLILRDVMGYSTAETASALELSSANVKTTLHRARRAMAGYDRTRCVPSPQLSKRSRDAVARFLTCLMSSDVEGLEALLHQDVYALNDGGGEFFAARRPVVGRAKVALFHTRLMQLYAKQLTGFDVQTLNGVPALLIRAKPHREGYPPRSVSLFEVDPAGQITAICAVMATRKLNTLMG